MMLSGPDPEVGRKSASWGPFVALAENRSALVAVRRLARRSSRPTSQVLTPSLLVLHGPPGTGKTLLAQTLVDQLTAQPSGPTARIVVAGELVRTPGNGPDPFAEARDPDVLVIEDLQRLPVRSAGELERLLDDRAARRRPTVITSSDGPAGLTRLPRRLTSRLAAGLVIRLDPPGTESRRILLEQLARKRGLQLTDEVLDWLATSRSRGGIRSLIGTLSRLNPPDREATGPLDREAVRRQLIDDPVDDSSPIDRIVLRVSTIFGVRPTDLLGSGRQRSVLVPRQVAMYLAREVAKISLPRVGTAFGRDHSTVLHACRKVAEAVKDDVKLRRTVRELTAELT
jgi:chromosomal replication initiator protein